MQTITANIYSPTTMMPELSFSYFMPVTINTTETDADNTSIINQMASPTVFRHAASLDDLVSIVSRYYSVPLAIREALLQGLRYDENLFVAVMTLMNQYHLDSMSFEVVKTILGKFSSDYFLRTLALIESENEELFHRLALVESLTFYSGVTPSEKNKALNELLKKISNQHVRAYLQETLESLKLGSDLAVSSIRK